MRKKILCYAIISLLFCPFSYNLLTAVENTQDFSKMEEAKAEILAWENQPEPTWEDPYEDTRTEEEYYKYQIPVEYEQAV